MRLAGAVALPARMPEGALDPFAGMAVGYARASTVASFGLVWWWRRRLVEAACIRPGDAVADLMTGTGEMWRGLTRRCGADGQLTAIDSDSAMGRVSLRRLRRRHDSRIVAIQGDARATGLTTGSIDVVTCAFGLKTLDPRALDSLLGEVHRILRPGGTFACLEVSVPAEPACVPAVYLYYLRHLMPAVVSALNVDPTPHRQLAGYVERFGDGRRLLPALLRHGFAVREWSRLWRGCAVVVAAERLP